MLIQSRPINRYTITICVTTCDFLGNVGKLSTKNTAKLENFLNRYAFLKKLT